MLLYTLPVIGALIGWITNYLAVKMLFHPRREIKILFFSIQGVFPKRQKALARKLGQLVSAELFSMEEVSAHMKEAATSDATMELVGRRIEEAITDKLPQALPMLAMFLNDALVAQIKGVLVEQLRGLIVELTELLSSTIEKDLDVHQIVEQKVAAFSSDKLEEVLFSIMRREFKFIEAVGAVLGLFIGIFQVFLLSI